MHHLFVYGTLRPGEGNHRLLAHPGIDMITATAEGLALYDGPGFPYAAPLAGHRIVGTLCSIPDDQWRARLDALDRLEGYDPDHESASHYLRRHWTVTPTPTGQPVTAWVYLAGRHVRRISPEWLVASGDWLTLTRRRGPIRRRVSH